MIYCDDESAIGAPFYIMEKLNGTILSASNAPKLNIPAKTLELLSFSMIDNLVNLHQLNIQSTQLDQLGKPEGYVERQVEGWIKRYYLAETDKITALDAISQWLPKNLPLYQTPAFLHNDYKYDNLILDENNLAEIKGVLDWEMSTVGDPLMDLGATLAYWFEAHEPLVFRQYNLTWLPGNITRKALIDYYGDKSGRNMADILFYFVFGLFKNAVIAQQIYHRWKQGHSSDARFGALLPMIQLLGDTAIASLNTQKI